MRRAGTAVSTRIPTAAPARRITLSVSSTLFYLGIAIAAQSLWALVLLPVVLAVVQHGVIYREERYLEDRFGADYVRYKDRVRRWI